MSISIPPNKWIINFDFNPKSFSLTFFFFNFSEKANKILCFRSIQNEWFFFFSLTSELKNQLFTQLLFKMAWNHLIVHVGSYLLCDLITALLILALFPPSFVVFCSMSDHRLLQSDILPSWHLRSVCRVIIPVPVVHKQHRATSISSHEHLDAFLVVASDIPSTQDSWSSIFS